MIFSLQCPQCGTHFHASDEASVNALRDAHVKAEHGMKADRETLLYIAKLESEILELKLRLESSGRKERKPKKP